MPITSLLAAQPHDASDTTANGKAVKCSEVRRDQDRWRVSDADQNKGLPLILFALRYAVPEILISEDLTLGSQHCTACGAADKRDLHGRSGDAGRGWKT